MQEKYIEDINNFKNKIKEQNYIVTWSDLNYMMHVRTPEANVLLDILEKPVKNTYAFLQGYAPDAYDDINIYDVIKNGFVTVTDVSVDLSIDYNYAKQLLSDHYFTVKLWHVRDNAYCHHIFRGRNNYEDVKNYVCGKNKPELVMGRDTFFQLTLHSLNKILWSSISRKRSPKFLKFLQKPQKNGHTFMSGSNNAINNVIKHGFFTAADLANILDINYTKADSLLKHNYIPKETATSHGVVKLWHIIDNIHDHFVPIKNDNGHIDKYNDEDCYTFGMIQPELVISRAALFNYIIRKNKILWTSIKVMQLPILLQLLNQQYKNGSTFISGSKPALEDIIHHGFYSAAEIAKDLDIRYPKVKKLLNQSYKTNGTPKIDHVVKIWHVIDNSAGGHFVYIKNKTQRIIHNRKYKLVKNRMIGKNKPEPVVGVDAYINFRQKYTIHHNKLFWTNLSIDISNCMMSDNKSLKYYEKILEEPYNSNKYSFISGIPYAIYDVATHGFLTVSDIAVDLGISYTKAKRMLSPKKNKLKKTPKIDSKYTVKLWHVIDDDHAHHIYIKNPAKRINGHKYKTVNFNNHHMFGKNVPKRVIGLHTYCIFIKNFYDPSHTGRSQLDNVLSPYAIYILRNFDNFNNFGMKLFYINTLERLFAYRSYVYKILREENPKIFKKITSDVAALYYDMKNIPPYDFAPNPIGFSKPGYPKYKSKSHYVNQEIKHNYYMKQRELKRFGGNKQKMLKYLWHNANKEWNKYNSSNPMKI